LPSAPAIPTISPASRVKLTGPNDCPAGRRRRAPRDSSRRGAGGERRLERAADDQLHELRLGRGLRVERPLVPAVAKHRDAIGDLEHLRQAMAHVHTPTPRGCTRRRSGAGRRPRPVPGPWSARRAAAPSVRDERLGHLEQLAVGEAEEPRRSVREQLEVRGRTRRGPSSPTLPLQNRRSRSSGPARKRLFFTGSARISEVSWYAIASPTSCLRRGVPTQGFAPDPDRAQIGVDEPAGDPEEGRLARPVLADDGVTSPARQSKLTSVSARTAPNCRETPRSSRTASPFADAPWGSFI
jgi:hypothetical protein